MTRRRFRGLGSGGATPDRRASRLLQGAADTHHRQLSETSLKTAVIQFRYRGVPELRVRPRPQTVSRGSTVPPTVSPPRGAERGLPSAQRSLLSGCHRSSAARYWVGPAASPRFRPQLKEVGSVGDTGTVAPSAVSPAKHCPAPPGARSPAGWQGKGVWPAGPKERPAPTGSQALKSYPLPSVARRRTVLPA